MSNQIQTNPNNIVVRTYEDAERVVVTLRGVLNHYGYVSVGDLHDLVGLPSVHTDHKRGWSSLDSVKIRPAANGYSLDLPPTEEI